MLAAEVVSEGRQARKEKNLAAARALYAEAAKIYADQNDSLAYAHTIRHIADMYLDESNLVAAKPLYEESLQITGAISIRNFSTLQIRLGPTRFSTKNRATSIWPDTFGRKLEISIARFCWKKAFVSVTSTSDNFYNRKRTLPA